jgi:hypothetical protein
MTTETVWKDLPTLQDVAKAHADGWEIECYGTSGSWCSWNKVSWHTDLQYRGRPRQPVMKEVKMLCFVCTASRSLAWCDEAEMVPTYWVRQPHLDMIAKVPV